MIRPILTISPASISLFRVDIVIMDMVMVQIYMDTMAPIAAPLMDLPAIMVMVTMVGMATTILIWVSSCRAIRTRHSVIMSFATQAHNSMTCMGNILLD